MFVYGGEFDGGNFAFVASEVADVGVVVEGEVTEGVCNRD